MVCALGTPALCGDLKLENVHLCCGGCVKAAQKALEGVEGISNVAVDQDAGTVSFAAADRKTARKGVAGLAKAGFAGKATFDGRDVPLPKLNIEPGTKSNEVSVKGVHLCCQGCIDTVEEAVKAVSGVTQVAGNKDGTVTVTGTDVEVLKVFEALRGAGFNGTLATAAE
jgi:copper chaperone CopZ